MKKTFSVILFSLLLIVPAFSATINIPGDYDTIQEGIDAAVNGDIVLVADGTYTGEGNKNIDFTGKSITVRSSGGADVCIIDCESDGRAFYFHTDEGAGSVLEGFQIINGYVAGEYPEGCGGAIFCDGASPAISDCIFTGNTASNEAADFGYTQHIDPYSLPVDSTTNAYGGGIFLRESDAVITDCAFDSNTAYNYGGGLAATESNPSLVSCTFTANSAGNFGGGLLFTTGSDGSLTDCLVDSNHAFFYAGGIYIGASNTALERCSVVGNTCDNVGGGIYAYFNSEPNITYSIIDGNHAENYGGGFYGHTVTATIENNIICNNTGFGGLYFVDADESVVRNNDASGNELENFSGSGMPNNLGETETVNFNMDDCDEYYNIQLDPMFDNTPGAEPYTLTANSPCLDAGNPGDSRNNDSTFAELGKNYYEQKDYLSN